MGPSCPKCGTCYEWTESELREVVWCPKTYFCINNDCRELYVLTAEEVTALQERFLPQLLRFDEDEKRAAVESASESAVESEGPHVYRCACGTPIYTLLDGLVVGQTGHQYEFEHSKIIWYVTPTQLVTCTACLFRNYYENKIQKKPYVVCRTCQKATQDYEGWDGTDVEGGFAFGGYGSTQFDMMMYYFPGVSDGWHCYGCLDTLVIQGKGQKKYDTLQ